MDRTGAVIEYELPGPGSEPHGAGRALWVALKGGALVRARVDEAWRWLAARTAARGGVLNVPEGRVWLAAVRDPVPCPPAWGNRPTARAGTATEAVVTS